VSDTLYIRKLAIKYTAGFPNDRLRPMDFCDGINIVFGPNASGKTTTAHAIQALLWPKTGAQDMFLTGEIVLDGQCGHVTYSGGTRLDDPALPMPNLGEDFLCHRYMLAQHELLALEVTGDDFARNILNAARGGLDLEKAKGLLQYVPLKRGSAPRDLQNAQQAYNKAKNEERTIQHKETDLLGLKAELVEAQRAQQRLELLTLAVEYQAQLNEELRLNEKLGQFPPELATLNGEELQNLTALNEQIERCKAAMLTAEAAISDAQDRIRQTGLTDPTVVDVARASVEALCEEISTLEKTIDLKVQEQARAVAEAKKAFENLGGLPADGFANPLPADVVKALEAFVQRAEGLTLKQQTLEAQLHWLESITPPAEAQSRPAPEEAIRCLYDWLSIGDAPPAVSAWVINVALFASALAAVSGLLALLINKSPFGGLALLCGVAAFLIILLTANRATPRKTRAELEQRFADFGIDGLAAWSEPAIQQFLRELSERVAIRDLAAKAAEKKRGLELEATDLQTKMAPLEEEKVHIAAMLGIDPSLAYAAGNATLYYFVSQLAEWQRKEALAHSAQEELLQFRGEAQHKISVANAKLVTFGYAPCAGSGELSNMSRLLDKRKNDYVQAEKERKAALHNKETQEKLLVDLLGKRLAMLVRLQLAADAEEAQHQLTLLLPQREAFLAIRTARQDAAAIRAETEKKGRRWPDWDALIALDESALRIQQQEALSKAEKLSEISKQCGEYEQQIKSAKEQVACEQALATFEREKSKWRRHLDEVLHSTVGWYIATELDNQMMDTSMPEVFQHARQRFADFTNGRYDLRVQRSDNTFRAFDREDQAERGLGQLSSATRVQLLMAVRVAYVEKQESGVRLPLLMDEILARSDAAREKAIISATLRICQQGRQVFYFTSKPAELAQWEAQARAAGVELCVIDLAQTLPERVINPLPTTRLPLPNPTGLSHEEYGKALGVPRVDFTAATASAAHVWYAVEDNEQLDALLQANITTSGQLGSPHLTELIDGLLGQASAAKARAKAKLLDKLEALWREGRGKPLTYDALQKSGILSTETFEKEILALAEEQHWEAKTLINELEGSRVKQLRSKSIQRLRDYCLEQGYLVDGEPLTPAAIQEHVMGYAAEYLLQQVLRPDEVRQLCERVQG